MEISEATRKLSALAHEGRLSAFRLLVEAGPAGLAAGALARGLDMPPNSLSANLSILGNAGLVLSRRDGRSVIYSARYDEMSALLSYLMQDCCGGRPDICDAVAGVVRGVRCA